MRNTTDMLICRRLMKYERHLINFTINRLACAIIILAVCGNTFGSHNVNVGTDTNCTSHRTCAQCTNMTCNWSFENQSCIAQDQSFPPNISRKSCPNFKLTYEIYSNNHTETTVRVITIKLLISKFEVNMKKFLNEKEIKCEIDDTPYNASIEDDGSIKCNYTLPDIFNDQMIDVRKPNPLLIVYFTIAVNDVRWKFDDDRDHYVTVYPMGGIMRGKSCEISSNCTTGFWNDGPAQYYCKWCKENNACKKKKQEGKCYVRYSINGTQYKSENASVVHVKDGNVTIEHFSPSVGLVTGGTTVTIRGHEVLGNNREVNVTVAGRECLVQKPLVDYEIKCMVANTTAENATDSGPVLVSYRSSVEKQAYELSSAVEFRFVKPQITNVHGPTCGPVGGSTRLTVVGQLLNLAGNVRVSLGKRGKCDVRLRHDDRVECEMVSLEDKQSSDLPVDVALDGVQYSYEPPFAFRFVSSDPTSVDANQTFSSITSGGTRLTVHGRFECVQNPRVYVVYGGTEYNANCTVVSNTTGVMECRAPKLPDGFTKIPVELPIGFRWTFGNQTVHGITDSHYVLSPDPEFTYFQVDDDSNPASTNVTIHGQNLDGMNRDDVTVQILGPSERNASDECIVQRIDLTRLTCRVNSSSTVGEGSRSVADGNALVITVGANLKQTVNLTPSGAAMEDHESQRLLAGVVVPVSIFSASITLLLVLSLLAKVALARSRRRSKKRYIYELRNVTAEKDDEKQSFLSSL